jgi:hypothetical protein
MGKPSGVPNFHILHDGDYDCYLTLALKRDGVGVGLKHCLEVDDDASRCFHWNGAGGNSRWDTFR